MFLLSNECHGRQSVLFSLVILPPTNLSLLLTNEPYSPLSTDHPPYLLLTSPELKTKEETNTYYLFQFNILKEVNKVLK